MTRIRPGQPGHGGRTASLRLRPVRIVNGVAEGGWTNQWEIICPACGDDISLDYVTVSPYLQRVRGPYPSEADGLAALREHRGDAVATVMDDAVATVMDAAKAVSGVTVSGVTVSGEEESSEEESERTVPNHVFRPVSSLAQPTNERAGQAERADQVQQTWPTSEQEEQTVELPSRVGAGRDSGAGAGAGAGERF